MASGSPRPNSVVLWTRLAPVPFEGGGMPSGEVEVRYRVCSDPGMRRTLRDGLVATSDAKAHAVHALVRGLEPGREYWYQFTFGSDESPVGRTRTADAGGRTAKLALASCNSFEAGHFAAYADMAAWSPDCVIHVGDYIYEGPPSPLGVQTRELYGRTITVENVRQHLGPETVTLWDYRNRYALYRSDPSLQAAHAAAPWVVAMDDHEIDNNWAADVPQDPWAQTPLEFKVRKLHALQAYYEHMPLEQPPTFSGVDAHLQMFGAYRFGPAQVLLLDTRQYRSDQPCGQGFPGDASCEALADPYLSMTGPVQERWLIEALARPVAPFNVIGSQTWFAPYRYNAAPEAPSVNMDQWDGYPIQRQRLIDAMAASSAKTVVLSGDWHCAAAMRIHQDPWNAGSRRVGHNFCGTSISSHCPWWEPLRAAKDFNPHVDHVNGGQRGYVRCEITAEDCRAEFRVVADPRDAASAVSTDIEIRTRDA
ncbi:MAG: alkaline phosphatase D family protein [Rhodospirillaceae bacterium]|nr:alkaline phosphatase D family protein [Rhodospirillaceae bacterium]